MKQQQLEEILRKIIDWHDDDLTGYGIHELIEEARTILGTHREKTKGNYMGRKPTAMAKIDEIVRLNRLGNTKQAIADELGISLRSVYRALGGKS